VANLASTYPGNPIQSDLYNALDFFGQQQRDQQFQTAQRNNQINQEAALQDMLFQKQNQPFKLDEMRLGNEETGARIPGVRADSQIKQNNATISNKTLPDQLLAKKTELAKTISEADLASGEALIKRMLISTRPEQRKAAEQMMEQLYEIRKMRMDHTNKMSQIEATGTNAERVANIRKPNSTPKEPKSFVESLRGMKKASEKYNTLLIEAKIVENENPALASTYRAMAEEIRPQAEAELSLNPKAGTPDLNALPGGGIPTNPVPSIRPANNPAAASPNPSAAVEPLRKAVSAAGWKFEPEIYEYRIAPDGKPQRRKKQ